jgi:hypothetical protein
MFFILLLVTVAFSQASYTDLSAFDQAVREVSKTSFDTILPPDTTNYTTVDEIDGLVYISIEDPEYRLIDSIQGKIDNIKKRLSANEYGRKILSFDCVNQRKYMDYLDKYKLCSIPAIYAMASDMLRIKELELKSAQIVLSTQTGASRSVIFLHVKKLRDENISSRRFLAYLESLEK